MISAAYPVLVLFEAIPLQLYDDEKKLTTTTERMIKRGVFNNVVLVDLNGKAHLVEKAVPVSAIGPLFGYDFWLEKVLRIDLVPAGEPYKITFDELLAKVTPRLLEYYQPDECIELEGEEDRESRSAARALRRKLNKSTTITDLFELVREQDKEIGD